MVFQKLRLSRWASVRNSNGSIVIGVGILVGGVQTVFDYMNPREGNPYVILFHITVVVLWALFVMWIYFGEGAEFLARHPGWLNYDMKSAFALKLLFAIMLLGGAIAEVTMRFDVLSYG